jgi:cholesterol oxidase
VTHADKVMQQVATEMGAGESYHATPVGVYFGEPGKRAADPFFGGAGPERTGCTECGSCMTGCRMGAKNTLTKNYLYLAEQGGAKIIPMTTVTGLRPHGDGSYEVDIRKSGRTGAKFSHTLTAGQVVLAAGTWGTQNLLHRMRENGALGRISPRLGELSRTNSEAILGVSTPAVVPDRDFSTGVAITSSFHPDSSTHIEPVRYGKGSNAMGLLQTIATDGDSDVPQWKQALSFFVRHPLRGMRLLSTRRWSERTLILLVMQSLDNSLTTYLKRGLFGRPRYTSKQGHGEPNPTFIRAGYEANTRAAKHIDGTAGSNWGELAGMPLTAHFIGGCAIASDAEHGVIDPYHRVFNYPGLSVVDGAAVSANLGVNPSLTITAQAERAFAMWPNKGEADPRPDQSAGYRRIAPVPPAHPAVPAEAPGALHLPPLS